MALNDESAAVLGLLVVLLRSLRRWSQAELARASGVHKSQISDYELGRTAPREATLRRLAAAVAVPWAAALAVLPALRALPRRAGGPSRRGPALPGARERAAPLGRGAVEAFRREVEPFLRARLPALAGPEPPSPAPPAAEPRAEPAALGLLIVLLRSLRHWSQVELAGISGVQRSQISTYELGNRAPRRRTLERLADASGVPLKEALEALPFLLDLVRAAHGGPAVPAGLASLAEGLGRFAEGLFRVETAFRVDRIPAPAVT